ncbi:hypothetical protein M3Y96_00599100 [Aphelenchoides besseyi]|nr:hypothetical protein M3Y96_00599100 [Aphelenchoides besseyi]
MDFEVSRKAKPKVKPRRLLQRSATTTFVNQPELEPKTLQRSASVENLAPLTEIDDNTCFDLSVHSKDTYSPNLIINNRGHAYDQPPDVTPVVASMVEKKEVNDNKVDIASKKCSPIELNNKEDKVLDDFADYPLLWQQIVRTHPIWYLSHLNRVAVSHLLRPMEPGLFICRSSSKSDSMALSIKMHDGWPVDVENYLIERIDGNFRLEGSPNRFASLPQLVLHYCEQSDELPIPLKLPDAIQSATTTVELAQISLLGQDFWTSEMAHRRSRPSSIYSNAHENGSLQMSRSVCGSLADFSDSPATIEPRRRSTLRLGTATIAPNEIEVDRRRPVMGVASGLLKKSQSAYGGIARSEATDSKTNVNANSKTKFFRNFLPNYNPDAKPRTIAQADYADKQLLDDSDYFVPRMQSSSPSDDSCENGREKNPFVFASVATKPEVRSKKLTKTFPSTSSISSVGSASISAASAIRRGISSRLRNFRSATAKSNDKAPDRPLIQRSKDDYAIEKAQPPRPQLQRGKTELSSRSLAGFQPKMSTFGVERPKKVNDSIQQQQPPMVPPHRMTENAMQKCIEELKRKRRGNEDNPKGGSLRTKDEQPNVIFRDQAILRPENHRRSVPNFSDENSNNTTRQPVARLGRAPGTGKLEMISEGLVTPIVRRKQFNRQRIPYQEQQKEETDRSSNENKPQTTVLAESLAAELSEIAAKRNDPQPIFVHRVQPIAKVKPQPIVRSKPTVLTAVPSTKMDEISIGGDSPRRFDVTNGTDPSDSFVENVKETAEDDTTSVAGTIFNDPWESNMMDNLLDIAEYCQKPKENAVKNAYIENFAHETIAEAEEDPSSCSSCSSTASPTADVEVQQVPLDPEEADDLVGMSEMFGDNSLWLELSRRIPSESGTMESNRGRSSSLLNVSRPTNSPMVTRGRAQTPGAAFQSSQSNDALDDLPTYFNSFLPAPSPARLRTTRRDADPGYRIQRFVERIATDHNSTFGSSLRLFIECTLDATSDKPISVLSNIRQFISGMKNYLIRNGEAGLLPLIERESARLQSDEFLNVDAILEGVLHKVVLLPVKFHIYHILCRHNICQGSFESITVGTTKVRSMRMEELGFPSGTLSPDLRTLEKIRTSLRRCQTHYSPFKKLEHLLRALSLVIGPFKRLPRTDHLVRWMVYLLAKTSTVTCEVEATYMFELLPPQILSTGDAFFYLSALFTAVHVLKNVDSINRLARMSAMPDLSSPQASLQSCIEEAADAFVRVAIPNEMKGSITYLAFPAVKQMTVQRLCRVIAQQSNITNGEEYGLCILCDGYETPLHGSETPQDVRNQLLSNSKPHMFVYKRHEAKIAWPSTAVHLTSSSNSSTLNATSTFGSTQSRFF